MRKKILTTLLMLVIASWSIGCAYTDLESTAADTDSELSEASDASPELGSEAEPGEQLTAGESFSIVSTIFPQYDWVRQILGDRAEHMELTQVINSRVDLHSFQPSVSDIVRISTADMLIYVGGESDGWVADALRQAINPDMIVINLMDILGDAALREEVIEGMEHTHDHAHDHGHHHHDECESCSTDGHHSSHSHDHDDCEDCTDDHHHGHGECEACPTDDDDHHHGHHHGHHHDHHHGHTHFHDAYDEHVWLSLRNAVLFATAIAEGLSELDPAFADMYRENLLSYVAQLAELDEQFREVVASSPRNTLLFGDRFPFRYFVEDYGLNYYAAFPGCHAEAEASFSTIIFLAGKIDELNLHTVVVTESANLSIAETIIRNTTSANQEIVVLDSMQSTTSYDFREGITYLSIMQANLEALRQILS